MPGVTSPRQEATNTLRRCLRASRQLAEPSSGAGSEAVVHSSLRLLFHALRSLFSTGVVPDRPEFERFLAIFISEVADNTRVAGARAYARQKRVGNATQSAPFDKEAKRSFLLAQGLSALVRCAWQYLLSGGGHGALVSPRSRNARRSALGELLRDFHFYDDLREARGLPSATAAGLDFPRDGAPRFCHIFRYPSLEAPKADVNWPKAEAYFKQVISYARDVGGCLARMQPTLPSNLPKGDALEVARSLNCSDGPGRGLLQNMERAKALLKREASGQTDASILARFLSRAMDAGLSQVGVVCRNLVGKDLASLVCDPKNPNARCSRGQDANPLPGIRVKDLPPGYAELPLDAEGSLQDSASRSSTASGASRASSESSASRASSESSASRASSEGSASRASSEGSASRASSEGSASRASSEGSASRASSEGSASRASSEGIASRSSAESSASQVSTRASRASSEAGPSSSVEVRPRSSEARRTAPTAASSRPTLSETAPNARRHSHASVVPLIPSALPPRADSSLAEAARAQGIPRSLLPV